MSGARKSTRSSAAARRSAAGPMSGEWNAPPTSRRRARGDERGVLAERVAGGRGRGRAARRVPRGDRAQEQRRLLGARAGVEPRERILSEQLQAAREQGIGAVGLLHAVGMAALAGE